MKKALALMGVMAIVGCSEAKTEKIAKHTSAPAEIVDRGVDTPQEAVNLVERFRRKGFEKLAGMFRNGTAALWDPSECEGTKADYANGVALTGMQAVSKGGIEITQPVHPSLRAINIQYLRVCDDAVADLTGRREIPVRNSGEEEENYGVLEDYRARMASIAMAETEKTQ